MIWCTNFPQEYWVSNYTLGKLVQINNAYSIKMGLPPKDVVFGGILHLNLMDAESLCTSPTDR
ncbi:MAG TPA: hypothetical protein EYH24_03730 [Thermococcus paralvinellae]|uniref:Uncharacterized protein n=1 Tax=Thermococcus paralvinellae TaxID=582419 RepID=A0A832ZFF9_9EURY|nr:hypothetical protein [Thermococcus paralvinellae]